MKSKAKKKTTKFPKGWDEQRARRVLEHYEKQTEDEEAAEIEKGLAEAEAMMHIPCELVPRVRRLITSYENRRSAARRR